jgi:hypothetical protein
MAFLRRSCKNVPGDADQMSMKAMMWRYRDRAGTVKSHLSTNFGGIGKPRLSAPFRNHMLG